MEPIFELRYVPLSMQIKSALFASLHYTLVVTWLYVPFTEVCCSKKVENHLRFELSDLDFLIEQLDAALKEWWRRSLERMAPQDKVFSLRAKDWDIPYQILSKL